MKLPNSYGSVTKLTGKRRKPYLVRVTVDCAYDEEMDEYIQKRKVLGCYKTRSEALAALAEYNENPYDLLSSDLSFIKVWELVKPTLKKTEDRMKVYENCVKKYLDPICNMPIKTIKTAHLQKVIDDCEYGGSTKSNIKVVMNHVFNYAVKNDLVKKNYVDYVKFERDDIQIVRKVYTEEEIKYLWDNSDMEENRMLLIIMHQGCRIKELFDMRIADINLEDNTFNIPKGKNKFAIRTIPINLNIKPLVIDLINNSDDGMLFHMTRSHFEHYVAATFKHTPYDVKHTFVTKAYEMGIDKTMIQKLVGHKPESVLEQHYLLISMDDMKEAISQVAFS